MTSTSAILGFEANIREIRNDLERKGYKVELSEIFGHYTYKGETYKQPGFAIRVYPHKDER